ncbi:unnamed protein product [Peronospora destructor]|uniref:Uncharacterized protein n=1 Tax=Peronospora destructor TaxID=86335 RepID=A0AAV0T9A4_9STRA|nr:unnamed protein product [Peronospora destructor]
METTPTTTRRSAAAARAGFSSLRMMEAQRTFQSVVKHELQLLLLDGVKREEAVKLLLRRIVASTEPPEATAVRGVMRQFQMNYDDAMRALIVKQELGRLKRQGLDSFAAIEELTRKMKRREDETAREEEEDEKEEDRVEKKKQHKDVVLSEEEYKENSSQAEKKEMTAIPAVEMASLMSETDGNETSLSLCQRIGQVSISSGNTPEKELEKQDEEANEDTDGVENESIDERNKARIKSPLRVRRPLNSTLADLTPQTRKRRAAFGMKYETGSNNCNNSGDRNVKSLFPNLKKQKLCAAVGDGFLQIVTLKSKSASATSSKSTSGVGISGSSSSGEKGGGPMRSDHSTKSLLKRPRVSPTGMADNDGSPIAEELHVSHVHHRHHTNHHSKRQKSGSTH